MRIQYTLSEHSRCDRVSINDIEVQNTGDVSMDLGFFTWNTIMFEGQVTVERLILDGIDTEYFVHHGFNENKGRGNAGTMVKYYFKTPIWQWFIEWKQNDNNTIRQISKTHQGFIPL